MATKKFNRVEWDDLSGPVVYVVWQGRSVVYVGYSKCGMRRPMSPDHHAADAIKNATDIEITHFKSEKDAKAEERHLIQSLKPSLNFLNNPKKVGRPKIEGGSNVIIKIRVPSQVRDRLWEQAKSGGRIFSRFISEIFEKALLEMEKESLEK